MLRKAEANMTEENKKSIYWTAGIIGVIVVAVLIAYALDWIPTEGG